jgi:pimeloyl-ACP methyl ester carboxylesterase
LCGYVSVPLDRTNPKTTTIQVYFELYPHTAAGPAQSAILVNPGGPAASTTDSRDFYQFFLASDMDVHDLLLIDDRGRGMSGAIDCEELQHGTAGFVKSEIDCVAQLGPAASRYGTGDIADDVEAVRKALGYDLVDYFGSSYGGADATAYSARYGRHVRSIVMDAPLSSPGMNQLLRQHFRTQADSRMVRLDCQQSVLCSQDQFDPDGTLRELSQTVRQNPVEGDGYDVNGNLLHVKIDDAALFNFVFPPYGAFANTGEILAAADALKKGDAVPLLRLGAEGSYTLVGDSGDPTGFSVGDFYAVGCADTTEPWDWTDPVSERKEQYDEAVADLPLDYYTPFSKSAATNFLYFYGWGKQCFWWQRPTAPSPITPPHAEFPHSPTLVLDGDMDNLVPYEETNEVAELFPNSTAVIVKGSGHETVNWSFTCAQNMILQLIENLNPGDTSCANTAASVLPAVGRFPILVKDARAANVDPSGNNQIGIEERKTVSVAVATAIDALKRSTVNGGTGVGLRGGTFESVYGATSLTTTLTNCSFATDLIVNGTLTWGSDNSIVADLTVSGPGTAGGSLHITGFWEIPGPVGNFSITGTLGGKQVAVLVPEA